MSEDALRLRALAARMAPSLLAKGAVAVAVTGSAGRGDAGPGSDLDLWIIDDAEGVSVDVVDGVPVTLMRESRARVMDLGHLAGVEVDVTHVILDPEGLFARVLALFAENAERIRADNVAGARARVAELVEAAAEGSAPGRLWAIREAAHLAASVRVYTDSGLMMPKMRHLAERLPAGAYALLVDIHGIDDVAPHAADLAWASSTIGELLSDQLRALIEEPHAIPPPDNAVLKLTSGDVVDGVLLLRRFFQKSFIDQVLAVLPNIPMVQFLEEDADPAIRVYWEALHGLDDDVAAKAARARSQLDELLVLLG